MSVLASTKRYLEPPASWAKQHEHPIKVVGALLFVLALLTGVFWLAGSEVEPLAFVLGMLSSLCFASSSIANYIVPDRKPISAMSFDEILAFIPSTDANADWHGVATAVVSERFLKEDPRLRFRAKFTEDGIQSDDFVAPWANCYPDKSATGYWYDLFYDDAIINRCVLVSVDGGRALLPCPYGESQEINRYHYAVAKIHDGLRTLDNYLARSTLIVK